MAGSGSLTGGYKDLVAWQKAMDLVEAVYGATAAFPAAERFGLASQLRRAAVSIPSNISEGYARRTRSDYIRFVDVARGSANEVETQLLIARRLGFGGHGPVESALRMVLEVQRILKGLGNSLRRHRTEEA